MLLGENENCFNIMQLLLNTLYMISETDKDLDFSDESLESEVRY